jgi:hypothetical protein
MTDTTQPHPEPSEEASSLPPLPAPYAVGSTIRCTACGAPYLPPMTLAGGAAQWPGGLLPPHACRCGNTQFGGTVGYDSLSPAQYTADQMRTYAQSQLNAMRVERDALRASIEALRDLTSDSMDQLRQERDEAREALRAALASPEGSPR